MDNDLNNIDKKKTNPRKRVGKREMLKRLNDENEELKSSIGKMQQQIAAVEAQNEILGKELLFFHQQILDALPSHPELMEKGKYILNKLSNSIPNSSK